MGSKDEKVIICHTTHFLSFLALIGENHWKHSFDILVLLLWPMVMMKNIKNGKGENSVVYKLFSYSLREFPCSLIIQLG